MFFRAFPPNLKRFANRFQEQDAERNVSRRKKNAGVRARSGAPALVRLGKTGLASRWNRGSRRSCGPADVACDQRQEWALSLAAEARRRPRPAKTDPKRSAERKSTRLNSSHANIS